MEGFGCEPDRGKRPEGDLSQAEHDPHTTAWQPRLERGGRAKDPQALQRRQSASRSRAPTTPTGLDLDDMEGSAPTGDDIELSPAGRPVAADDTMTSTPEPQACPGLPQPSDTRRIHAHG